MKRLSLVLVTLCLSFVDAEAGIFERSVTATVDTGKLAGETKDKIDRFLGIPYAAPPIGDLRWKPPAPAAAWEKTRPAKDFAMSCLQPPPPARPKPPALEIDVHPKDLAPGTSEDCLYLNVWTPKAKSAAPLPVIVWIHGGGFIQGSAARSDLDGATFARDGVVFVALNYRLGRFGFFAHPALSAEDPDGTLGNYGLLDIIAALQWVQRNIAAFGGDPANVTIAGQSAGASLVDQLMVSPLAKGLYAKAIAQSAPAFQPWPALRGKKGEASAESIGKSWAESVGVTAESAAALRALPAEKVVEGSSPESSLKITPIVDGKILPAREAVAFANGLGAKVPYLTGANSYDGSVLLSLPAMTPDVVMSEFGKKRDRVAGLYMWRNNNPLAVATSAFGDHTFVMPARYMARKAAENGSPTYLYHFAFVPRERQQSLRGAPHGSEICLMFETCVHSASTAYLTRTTDSRIGATMRAYWINFARTGDPNGSDLVTWPAYTKEADQMLVFSNNGYLVLPHYMTERLDAIEDASPYTPQLPKPAKKRR